MRMHTRNRRRGLTLIEAVVSLVIISVLMLGLSSSVMIGVRALPSDTELGAADREVQQIINQLRADVSGASSILCQKAGNSVRLVITMAPTGAVGEPGVVVYDIIGDVNMIRRRTDSNAYVVLTTSMDDYKLKRSTESGNLNYLHLRFEFSSTIQQYFEAFIPTPSKPEFS
ncbi:MAG: prepilin-type N-terminal cleavage/methylation domain-containing protein [Phycisphaerales bacterium]